MTAPALPVAIAYSGGSSSEELIQAVVHGELPRPEHVAVFFAHTGIEHEWTYEAADRVRETCRTAGIPFFDCCVNGDTLDAHLLTARAARRAELPPLYVDKGGAKGQLVQKCSRAYKVAPIRRAQSAWVQSIGKPKRVAKWIGFALDEQHRATKAIARQDVKWERLEFPAIRRRLSRDAQRANLRRWGVEPPRFSMCTICPHKTDARWQATPEAQRARVIEVDEAIRDLSSCGIKEGETYLSDELIPVERVLRRGPRVDPQLDLFPGAGCDGGACFL